MLSGREVERSNIPIQRMVHRPPQASIHYVSLCSFLRPRSRRETTQISVAQLPKCGHARLQARRAGAKRPSLARAQQEAAWGPAMHARTRTCTRACASGHGLEQAVATSGFEFEFGPHRPTPGSLARIPAGPPRLLATPHACARAPCGRPPNQLRVLLFISC